MSLTSVYRENSNTRIRFHLLLALLAIMPALSAPAETDRRPLVVVASAQTETVIRQVPLTGTVTSVRVAQLSTEVSGQVERVGVDVGDRVEAGDVLLELDREIEQFTLLALQAETQQAQAGLADARRRYQDAEQLRQQKSISENELRLLQSEVEIDAAALKRTQAAERRQQARVERHTLKAPFAGVISERSTEVGEWIEPGRPVMTLVATDDLRIDFRVPQEFYARIGPQSKISVTLDALPDREFDARIETVVPVSDPGSRTFIMHVRLDQTGTRMTPGMSVHGKLELNTGKQGVVVSRDALLRYPDGRVTAWIVEPGSEPPTVSERQVETGIGFNGRISILAGLEAGDVVVLQGNESLQEGQQVSIQAKP